MSTLSDVLSRDDLRGFFQRAHDRGVEVMKATRPHVELFRVDGTTRTGPSHDRSPVVNGARPRRRVPQRDVQIAARHADPHTTTIYDRRRQNFDRHAGYVVVAFVASG
jgi:hypothetical protein